MVPSCRPFGPVRRRPRVPLVRGDSGHLRQLADRDHDPGSRQVAGQHRRGEEARDDPEARDEADDQESRDEQREHRGERRVPLRSLPASGDNSTATIIATEDSGSNREIAARSQKHVGEQRHDADSPSQAKAAKLAVRQTLRDEQRPQREAGEKIATQPRSLVSSERADEGHGPGDTSDRAARRLPLGRRRGVSHHARTPSMATVRSGARQPLNLFAVLLVGRCFGRLRRRR